MSRAPQNLVVRILNEADKVQIFEVSQQRDSIFKCKTDEEYHNAFLANLPNYLDPKCVSRLLVGAFDGEELLCFSGMLFWTDLPYWSLVHLKTRPRVTALGVRNNGLSACYGKMLEIAESAGRYRHYFAAPIRGTDERFGLRAFQRLVPALQRYDFVTEAVIPAGHRSEFKTEFSFTGNRIFEHDIHIRAGTLKQEFRPADFLDRSKIDIWSKIDRIKSANVF